MEQTVSQGAGVDASAAAHEALGSLPSSFHGYFTGTGFFTALFQSFLIILVTEIGDRTFFIAAILAMKNGRLQVLVGALVALYLMTILSAALGVAFPLMLDVKYTSLAAAVLFLYFGGTMLKEWYQKRSEQGKESEELHDVEEELNAPEDVEQGEPANDDNDKYRYNTRRLLYSILSPLVVKAFTMTFLAEWGDRSQFATIALAAAKNLYGVILGGMLGHTVCTSIAVVGGRLLAAQISERAVLLTGGVTFVLFAVVTVSGRLV
ncbi:hypothetical protein NDN08_002843 [Rhodosorus marinus]|uniref:GDT1 family protein n=1 Tax=Rhodosorus marinus TaxID=101924 RepID=A0AAV8UUV2_9RHOD|nr:hypothetical protein NDN08_002843 [Rhodosorus marinus]